MAHSGSPVQECLGLYFHDKTRWQLPGSGRLAWATWAIPVTFRANSVDYVCKCHDGLSVGSSFHEVHDVTAGVAGASYAGVRGVMDLAAKVARVWT